MSDSMRSAAVSGSVDQLVADVVAEITDRLHAGKPVDVEEHIARHPELADRLRPLLAALEVLNHFSSSSALDDPLAGAPGALATGGGVLGDYRIIRQVGRGGMGVVHEAEQISLGRRVALKVLPFAATMDPRHLQRFHNEARAAASLEHPHIVPVYGVGCEHAVHFYAMKFIDGRTLADLIAEQHGSAADQPTTAHPAPLPADTAAVAAAPTEPAPRDAAYFRRVAEWVLQAAEALEYAHQLGVVHRDVKPANLMLDTQGKLWVTDFGLARLGTEAGLTMTGDLLGTLRYMSPEQALAKHGLVDHRTDIYALGATLYELLTLRPAVDGKDREEVMRQLVFEEPKPPRTLERAVPADLETITLKALAKEPAERYRTAQELADDLRRWLEDRPIQARRPSLVQRARKWARRHRAAMTAAAVCLLVTLAAIVGSVGWALGDQRGRQREAENNVRQALDAAAPGLEQGNPWDHALISAAQRAEAQLNGGMVGQSLRRQVEQLQKDVRMLAELERIRLDQAGVRGDRFDLARSDPQYGPAFREYGIDVETLGPEEAAALVQNSAIRASLVAGLDDWANALVAEDKEEGKQKARSLLAVARRADPDPWRDRLREALLSRWSGDLGQLTRSAPVEELSAATLRLLGRALVRKEVKVFGSGVELLQRAQGRYPADFWLNHELALALISVQPPRLEESIGFFRVAVALRPESPGARLNLGKALSDKGDKAAAIAAFREAIALKPDYATAHLNLGTGLGDTGDPDGGIAEYREAIRLKKDFPEAHCNLGNALKAKGQLEEAIAEYREAIRIKNDSPDAHTGLGGALALKGQLDRAIAEYREAIHINEEFAQAHYNLGNALKRKGQMDGAIAEYREAIRIDKDYPEAHCNLGHSLRDKGQFAEALTHLRRGHELGSKNPRWPYPSAQWGKQCERLVELDAKLPKVLTGEAQPADAAERIALAEFCCFFLPKPKHRYAAAARFYAEAFAAEPNLAGNLARHHLSNAANSAVMAAYGKGLNASALDDKERTRLRRQAINWLRADLAGWRQVLEKDATKVGPPLAAHLRGDYFQDEDFAKLRDEATLAQLPAKERQAWLNLWAEADALLTKAEGQDPGHKK